mmetsp:Transcript_1910/g.3111  ORF Transcript_1910/g.3111 Transcript_1910/m.3111 type:complete len:89 (+) Transcript_1910:211-477(+)
MGIVVTQPFPQTPQHMTAPTQLRTSGTFTGIVDIAEHVEETPSKHRHAVLSDAVTKVLLSVGPILPSSNKMVLLRSASSAWILARSSS